MPSTMAYRQGDIVLVSFPFTDLTSSKRRPALVLSPDSFNAAGEDLVLAEVAAVVAPAVHAAPVGPHLGIGQVLQQRLQDAPVSWWRRSRSVIVGPLDHAGEGLRILD